jgi:hypothetical protein
MTLRELEQQVHQLSVADRLSLLNTITQSLQQDIAPPSESTQQEKLAIVDQMQGFLARPGELAPTDAEIKAMLEQRRVEKYLA